MAKWNILISAPYFQPVVDEYKDFFDQHDMQITVPEVRERLNEEELLACVEGMDGVVCGDDHFTERVLDQCKDLKVISKWGTGIDSINKPAAESRGIAVKNTPNAFTDCVADTTVGYILNFARQLSAMDRKMKQGGWEKMMSRTLKESTVGVLGLGNIGRAVVRRLVPFGPRIVGFDSFAPPSDEFVQETGIEVMSMDDVIREADYLTLHCFLDENSRHLINADRLAQMKNDAVIVNTARGPLIHEQALIEALQAGTIGGAALDVFEFEPLPEESPLRRMDNVLIAPHNSNASPEAWRRIHESTLANLLEELHRYA